MVREYTVGLLWKCSIPASRYPYFLNHGFLMRQGPWKTVLVKIFMVTKNPLDFGCFKEMGAFIGKMPSSIVNPGEIQTSKVKQLKGGSQSNPHALERQHREHSAEDAVLFCYRPPFLLFSRKLSCLQHQFFFFLLSLFLSFCLSSPSLPPFLPFFLSLSLSFSQCCT